MTEPTEFIAISDHHNADPVRARLTKRYWMKDVTEMEQSVNGCRLRLRLSVRLTHVPWVEGQEGRYDIQPVCNR